MMWNLWLAASLLSGAAEFEVRTLDGQSATGQVVELNAEQLVLQTAQGRSIFAIPTLGAATRQAPPAADERKSNLWIELVDQSGLSATSYTARAAKAQVTLTTGARIELPTSAIRWVRFTPPAHRDPKLTKQWTDITETKPAGDLLVVRKNGSLDYLEGVLGDLDKEICQFEMDKEVIPVKRPKVEGLVYFNSTAAEVAEPVGQLVAIDGSHWAIHTAVLNDAAVKVTTPGGVAVELPLSEISRLDFSSGKIAYLSDLEPDSATYVPYFGFKDEPLGLHDFFRFHRDIGFDQSPLRLNGETYRKGLALQSRTALSYKLPGKFRAFKSTIGIDDSVRDGGSVRVEIKGDGKVLWQGDVRGTEPPRDLELNIAGVKRLDILVDFGEDLDIGDRLDLCDARVTK
jgi:hypothetical protein